MGDGIMSVLSMVGTLLLMAAVFVGAYYVSKLVSRRYQPRAGAAHNSMEVLDRLALGKDQALLLVRTAGRVFLLGVTQQHIERIEELDPDLLPDPAAASDQTKPDFRATFKDALKNWTGGRHEGGRKG